MIQQNTEIQLIVGSRASRLALAQVEEIKRLLSAEGISCVFKHKIFETQGDKDKQTPLTAAGIPGDFFTDALDQAVLDGAIDIAIHSAKDLPDPLREGLRVFALTKSPDETDAFVGRGLLKDLKPGAKIGTSSHLRARHIRELYPDVEVVEIRGTIEERIRLVDEMVCDGVVIATVALKRLGLEQRITDVFPWDGWPLQGQLAVVGRTDDKQTKKIFQPLDARRSYGKVVLVGAGPGDPDLITVKGIKALEVADCVFYDFLAHPDLLKYALKAEKINVGKRKGKHSLPQDELSRMLRREAIAGKTVVRLKGGDPLVFGRGAEEISYLRSYHIPVEVVPGVSSATGIPSGLGIPLTARGVSSSVAFVSGHVREEETDAPAPVQIPDADTIVFLMGLTKLPLIVQSLKGKGIALTMPVMVVSKGTHRDEIIVEGTLEDIEAKCAQANLKPPALIIVSETVKFWQNPKTDGEEILYTGTFPRKYESLGHLVHFPMIKIEKAEPAPAEAQKINAINTYDMVILTSRFAVRYLMEYLNERDVEVHWDRLAVASIGAETTEALAQYGITPQITAKVETSEGLFAALIQTGSVAGRRILFPRSSLSNPYLKDHLQLAGAEVDEVVVYRNVKPPKKQLPQEGIKRIIFTSPSTVKNFLEDYGRIPSSWKIYSRGPKTQQSLKELGYESDMILL